MKPSLGHGKKLYHEKKYEQALSEFLDIDEDPTEKPELSYYLGLCYTKLERYDEALLYLEQVVTNHENILYIYQCRLILSYIYSITGRVRLARFELDQILESGYESPQVFSALAYSSYAMKNVNEGIDFLKKALELDAENANAQNSMGYILAEENIDVEEGLKYCRKAVNKNPGNPAYLDSLGWAYYKLGNVKDAQTYLRKALDIAKKNRIIAGHMKTVLDYKKNH